MMLDYIPENKTIYFNHSPGYSQKIYFSPKQTAILLLYVTHIFTRNLRMKTQRKVCWKNFNPFFLQIEIIHNRI